MNKKGGFETIKVNGRYRVNSGEMAGRAAISGVGFAILSKQACQPYIDDGRLIEIEFEQSAALAIVRSVFRSALLAGKNKSAY